MYKIKFSILITLAVLQYTLPVLLHGQNIYWLESTFNDPRIVKTAVDGSELTSLPLPLHSLPQSLSYDEYSGTLLWVDLNFINARINRYSPGLNTVLAIADSQSALRGIAVNPLNGDIYWTSTNLVSGPKIWRCDRAGNGQTVLIDFGPASYDTPRSLGLDIANEKMYWTNFGAGKIQRADMFPGALVEDLISGLNSPSGLVVDVDSAKIYWTEMNGHSIKHAGINGENITVLLENLSHPHSIAVSNYFNRIAWTEMGSGRIKSATLNGTDIFDYGVSAYAPTGIIFENPVSDEISGKLHIVPQDTVVQAGSYLQFNAQIIDSLKIAHPTHASWSVKGDLVGPISEDGLLFTYFPGKAKIMAKRDSMEARTSLKVIDTTADNSGVNVVKVLRIFFNEKEKKSKTIIEGEPYILGGIPHPYNILNGTVLYFPHGSLSEDITLEINLPEMAKLKKDSIEYSQKIITGIQFNVFVNDTIIEPYYFNRPVSLAIPFKRGILKKYGIDAENLGLFFATDSSVFDSVGISHVIVDSSANRIFGMVEHFSSLVVREKEKTILTAVNSENNLKPEGFSLEQNYPNPFNPLTTIRYKLAKVSKVDLSIYNTRGQKIATLVSQKQAPGSYTAEWDATEIASGLYLYRLTTDQGFVQSKKLLLLK
jgi:hypothetical protein